MSNQGSTFTNEDSTVGRKSVNVFDPALSSWDGDVQRIRFSRFAHQFKRDSTVALYHSLTHQVVYLVDESCQHLRGKVEHREELTNKEREITRELTKRGFIVSTGYDEHKFLQEIQRRFLGKPAFGILYLLLTDICNLRCTYCFVEGAMPSGHTFSLMSEETAIEGLRFFADTVERNPLDRKIERPTIIFYGGEPLLNRKTFLTSLEEIARLKDTAQLPSNLSITLLTNATIVHEEAIKNIIKHGVSVAVSLDGPQDLHDANRQFADKRGTFQMVLANIQRMKEAGANVGISCTINTQNLNQLEKVFQWMITELSVVGLGFNMLIDLPGIHQGSDEYAQQATEKIIECYRIAREEGVYEDRIMRKVKVFVKKSLHVADCGGYGNQLVITPEGKIGPCHAYASSGRFFPGNLRDPNFDPFQEPIFLEWSSRSPFNIPRCYFCEAVGLCGGGCAYNAELKCGGIWEVDPHFCVHSKKILEWLIWDLLHQTTKERR